MNKLQIFNNEAFGELRSMEIDGKRYFAAIDIAKALGYSNTRDAIRAHCKGVVKCDGVSSRINQYGVVTEQNQQMNFIPEGDIYRLIAHSRLPNAEKFEQWMFDEVMPSVMRTGSYAVPQLSPNELILKIAQSNVDLEKRLAAVEQRVEESQAKIEQKLDTAVKVFSSPGKDRWKEDMERAINELVETYHLNPMKLKGNMYKDLEETGVFLQSRVSRMKTRLKRSGATSKEQRAITKLDAISHDKKLRSIFEGILKKYQALYGLKPPE